MKLKRKLDKAAFDALDKALQVFYTVDGDSYNLQIETSADDDPGELRRARDREKETAREQRERADRLQTQVDALVSDPNKQKDITTLETSWKGKLADRENELNKKITNLTVQLTKVLVTDKAKAIADKLAGDNADLLIPHLEKRLKVEITDDAATTRVLDVNGGLSAFTVEDLEKEFVANKKFSAIIIASNATGGASGGRSAEGSSAVPNGKKFHELSEAERVAWVKRDPAGFTAARDQHLASTRKF